MSPLTKLFVVLLVVLSLLQTAGMVVYVTKNDDQRKSLEVVRDQLAAAESKASASATAAAAAEQRLTEVQGEANRRQVSMNAALTQAQQQIADLNVQLAKASAASAQQLLDISRLTEGLTAAQETAAQQQQVIADLRQRNDTLVSQTSDLNAGISDLTNRLDVTERQRRELAEQLAQAQQDLDRTSSQLKGLGVSPSDAVAAGTTVGPNVSINGVIRETRKIGGIDYATISVGSADQVERGMEFKVVDRGTGDFLGTVTVDSVEANESTGRLAGPRIGDIRAGTEIRTQY